MKLHNAIAQDRTMLRRSPSIGGR